MVYTNTHGIVLKDKNKLAMLLVAIGFALIGALTLFSSVFADHGYSYNSTNELNAASNAPGRPGQAAPYVEQTDVSVGNVELTFKNPSVALMCFEYRTDGDISEQVSTNPAGYPEAERYPYLCITGGGADQTLTIAADSYVEVRSAFGAESDWFFDWTRFDVLQPPVAMTKADCKKGGWMNFADNEGNSFKNQGDCVSFVATGGRNLGTGN